MELLTAAARERGTAVVLVTHEARVAAYSDREVVVRDGRTRDVVSAARRDEGLSAVSEPRHAEPAAGRVPARRPADARRRPQRPAAHADRRVRRRPRRRRADARRVPADHPQRAPGALQGPRRRHDRGPGRAAGGGAWPRSSAARRSAGGCCRPRAKRRRCRPGSSGCRGPGSCSSRPRWRSCCATPDGRRLLAPRLPGRVVGRDRLRRPAGPGRARVLRGRARPEAPAGRCSGSTASATRARASPSTRCSGCSS